MKEDEKNGSQVFKRHGITARIRPTLKNSTEYFVCDYRLKGQRKLIWRSTLVEARQAASDAIDKIIEGQTEVLQLTNSDAHIYLRAVENARAAGVPLDHLARDHAQMITMLAGRATPIEACRDWLKRHEAKLPTISLADAKVQFEEQIKADGKSQRRRQQLSAVLTALTKDHMGNIEDLAPDFISRWLAGLGHAEKTRKNYRDAIGYFNRWCVVRGYVAKGTDWLENVQKYSGRNHSEIEIYTPDELTKLLEKADDDLIPFLTIGAFAGLRHAEIARLDWSEIDFDDDAPEDKRGAFIEVKASKAKTATRRLVPAQKNLLAWLVKYRKQYGKVCHYANTTKQLLKLAKTAGIEWKHNALRHSCISYRVAECADVPRVADESGNTPQIIRTNYLQRVKPKQAARWFSIMPGDADGKVVQLAA
jgi:integrase